MSSRTETFTIEQSQPGGRLDKFLCEKFPAASRGALQRLMEEGHIRVNGQSVKPTHTPRAGETVEVHWPEARPATAQPEAMPLDILFEDESLLVLNKPAGLVVHPAAGHWEHTLVNALLHHCRGSLSGIGGVARPGIVHRLDKETSGCLVIAKNDVTHLALSEQFAGRVVKKIYHAILCGELAPEAGEIKAAIARHSSHRKRMAVRDDRAGRAAHTSWRLLERLNSATLVEAQIHTASDPRTFPAPRPSGAGRRHLWRAARRPRQGTDQLRRPTRAAACQGAVLYPPAHAAAGEIQRAAAGGFPPGAENFA